MARTATAFLTLTVALLGLLGARCERPPRADNRAAATHSGSCDGIVDYGDEFEVSYVGIVWVELVGAIVIGAAAQLAGWFIS